MDIREKRINALERLQFISIFLMIILFSSGFLFSVAWLVEVTLTGILNDSILLH